jgi:pimeloyl-ACP methyl ester carboxylesterase
MKLVATGEGGASGMVAARTRALLLPGNDLCAEFYAGLAGALAARGVPTTAVTLPGYHREPPLPAPGWAALVDAVLPHVPEVLIGHSMGGLLAALVAARTPPALRRLVLLEPAIFPTAGIARSAANRYLTDVVLGDRTAFRNWNGAQHRVADLARYPPAMVALYEEVRRTSDVATARALFTELPALYPLPFARITVPTLLVRGARTGLLSRLLLAPLAYRLCGRAQSHVIPGAAHWIANEQDDAAADAIAGFVGA